MASNRESVQKSRKAFESIEDIIFNTTKSRPIQKSNSGIIDIRDIEVPTSLVESITNPNKVTSEPRRLTESQVASELSQVVRKLNSLLIEAKSILEMCGVTSVGSLSVGPVKPLNGKKGKLQLKSKGGGKVVPTGSAKSVKIPGDAKPPKPGVKKSK